MLIVQLFRETLSDKVHATTPKGIVGGFFGQLVELALYKLCYYYYYYYYYYVLSSLFFKEI